MGRVIDNQAGKFHAPSLLNGWFLTHKRALPWRDQPTPYRVWVSEVMLQQTRAAVVAPYFERWMERFPSVHALAEAPLELVLKLWEGLGYYSRLRNLHAGAQRIVAEFGGRFPSTREELLKIPGLGPYTVGAILSFGFQQRALAIDGNVVRVMARYSWTNERIDTAAGIRKIEQCVENFLPSQDPWVTMEALIELGATVCTPTPRCHKCPIRGGCAAHARGDETRLPIKAAKPQTCRLVRGVAIVECQGQLLVRRNDKGQLMADLWEFPYFEDARNMLTIKDLISKQLNADVAFIYAMEPVKHSFTRYLAQLYPFYFRVSALHPIPHYQWAPIDHLHNLPFSSGHRKILNRLFA